VRDGLIVIPARFGSSRFPGKPLEVIAGKFLIDRVWRIAVAAAAGAPVVVATEDQRIADVVADFGGQAVMTSDRCRNGSERALEAARVLGGNWSWILNVQSDAPLIPPGVLSAVIEGLKRSDAPPIVTPAVRLTWEQWEHLVEQRSRGVNSGTTVTFDKRHSALYFSKSIIPAIRKPRTDEICPVYQHLGLYGYRFDSLEQYVKLAPTSLEEAEQLEQLRALENGMRILVVQADLQGRTLWSIDNPSDVKVVEEIIAREGELVP
jgi:3-deoxy-manno-octulosonate cytidylyltransferase (CMP-KDO synthetase)